MKRLALSGAVLLLLSMQVLAADPLDWVNHLRRTVGSAPVQPDALLSESSSRWAQRLAASGTLSHRGRDGSTALDRYRALGGTEVRVGEIIGAGPDLLEVERAWTSSPEHRRLAVSPDWTHCGWGTAGAGADLVAVMMFTQKLVDELAITRRAAGLSVSGRLLPGSAVGVLLYDGLEPMAPDQWDPAGRRFRFDVPARMLEGYLRLGYLDAGGRFTLTNAITLPRGTGSRGAGIRSAAPAPPP